MSSEHGRDTTLMLRAVDAVHDAGSLDAALHGLVQVLQSRFELWHANFAWLPTGADAVRVLASWSLAESAFIAGTEVSTTITPVLRELFQDVQSGEVAMVVLDEAKESLVDHLLRAQGVSSVVAVPVNQDDSGVLILTLGSSTVGMLHEIGARFYLGLAAGIRDRTGKLTAAST